MSKKLLEKDNNLQEFLKNIINTQENEILILKTKDVLKKTSYNIF